MNGLIKKDLLTIWKKNSSFSLLLMIGGIVLLVYRQSGVGIMMVSIFILPLFGSFEHFELSVADDKWKWDKYAIALPLTKSDIVRSRFYICGAVVLIMFILSLVLNIGAALVLNQFSLYVHIVFSVLGFLVGVLFMCIAIPCGYKFRLQGASVTAVLTMLITGGGVTALAVFDFDVFDITAVQFAIIAVCVTVLSAMLIWVSLKISTFFYAMKYR